MGPNPACIISPFYPGVDLAVLAGNRRQCSLDGCTNEGTMKCSRCNTAKYCSKKCQTAHRKQTHKRACQNTTVESIFIPEIPSSWTTTGASATTTSSESIRFARLVHDDTHHGKTVNTPAIYRMASRPSLISYFEHQSDGNDASFTVCLSGGDGAFLSLVRSLISLRSSTIRNYTILSHWLIDLKSISERL
jgi:hypothetical protein